MWERIYPFQEVKKQWDIFKVFAKVVLILQWGALFVLCPYSVLVGGFGLLSSLLLVGRVLHVFWIFWASLGWVVALLRGEVPFPLFLLVLVVLLALWFTERAFFASELVESGHIFHSPYLRRKLSRFLFLLFPLGIFPVFGQPSFRRSMLVLGALALLLEILRFGSPQFKDILRPFFRKSGREEEAETVSGVTLLLMGSAITALFPGRAGPLGVTLLVVGDGWASLAGQRWGKTFWREGKSWVGSFACVLASSMGALLLFPELVLTPVRLVAISLFAGLAEGAFRGVWDNFFMGPLIALAFCLLE